MDVQGETHQQWKGPVLGQLGSATQEGPRGPGRCNPEGFLEKARPQPRLGRRGGTCPETVPWELKGLQSKVSAPPKGPLLNPRPTSHSEFTRDGAWISRQAQICPCGWRLGVRHEAQTKPEVFLAALEPWVFWASSGSADACDRRLSRGGPHSSSGLRRGDEITYFGSSRSC